jgi:chromosome segregation ATPase
LLIRELIVENFMSYKYARVPFSSGLNIICGPNGSGKSSILLAISVALGQAYTERGRKLSDLIRWGEDSARVTIVFDNKRVGDGRPVPKFDVDYFRLSRYLNRDGNYWYETNFQTVNKSEVVEILKEFGLNPDNMLIIMHQHMMMEFGVISPQKKLLMVEEAVGFGEYRRNVLEAQEKLTKVLSEEESVSTLIKNAEQTLDYWKEEYERYQQRKEAQLKKEYLERELAWAQLIRQERAVEAWMDKIQRKEAELKTKEAELQENEVAIAEVAQTLNQIRHERNDLYTALLAVEKEKAGAEEGLNSLKKTLDNITTCYDLILTSVDGPIPTTDAESNDDLRMTAQDATGIEASRLETRDPELGADAELDHGFETRLNELQTQVQLLKQEADKLDDETTRLHQLMDDKQQKETTLQAERKRLQHLSAIMDQVSRQLEALDTVKKQITLDETRRVSLGHELTRLLNRIPPSIPVPATGDPIDIAKAVAETLQRELATRTTVSEQIQHAATAIASLAGDEQTLLTTIQVRETEIEKIDHHTHEITLFLEGKRDIPEIRCDKCGSLLTPEQWDQHLKDVAGDREVATTQLNTLQHQRKDVQNQLAEKRRAKDDLHQEERLLEAITPLATQAQQLHAELEVVFEALQQHTREHAHCLKVLADLGAVEGTPQELDSVIERRATDLQAEARTLTREIPRLEAALANFEDLHLIPQRERVETAQTAFKTYHQLLPRMLGKFRRYQAVIEAQMKDLGQTRQDLEEKASTTQGELDHIAERYTSRTEAYQDAKARSVLLAHEQKTAKSEIDELTKECQRAQRELDQLQPVTETLGPRVETDRSPVDISADIKVAATHLALLKDVSEDVEHMYMTYLNLYNELKEKAAIVSENRESVLKEVEERKTVWRSLLQSLLDDVNPIFKAFLEQISGTGWVSLVNTEDFEATGLELTVGYKGATPQVLNSHTQSGGERSSATMAFLLALQRHIKSPLRAVDEFDVHMDPRNREIISHMLLMEMEQETDSQYLVITPGQLTNVRDDVHVITVQRVEDASEIKVMSETPQAT